ncbi:hypothetical protein LTSEMIS_5034 [Salmonella enterica subsp. enterica serovar Mississippi str. A4-633]|nr:hypothetical protein LTSEMIS_5034 [Salmonella enterica subsp. enterica serovar Mississippi str. A4-633]
MVLCSLSGNAQYFSVRIKLFWEPFMKPISQMKAFPGKSR